MNVAIAVFLVALSYIRVLALIPEDSTGQGRLWCPPRKYQELKARRHYNFTSAIISEIHGQIAYTPGIPIIDYWQLFFEGDKLARFLYYHVGVLGIDKLYLTVVYNVTLHTTPPTLEEIYPSNRFCVVDWLKLGAVEISPNPYFGPEDTWPKDDKGRPSNDLDYYKTLRAINPIYNRIRNYTDWVAVIDIDEFLVPVNFKPAEKNWCSDYHPALFHRAMQQMLMTGTSRIISNYKHMNESRHFHLPTHKRCRFGWSYFYEQSKCQPISAFSLPVYMWENSGPDHKVSNVMPNLKSRFPSGYLSGIKEPEEVDGQAQNWKSIYQTKYNPPMSGRSMHHNPSGGYSFQAPRAYHRRVSIQLGHNKLPRSHESTNFSAMVPDNAMQALVDSYSECMTNLVFENYEPNF